MKTKIKFFQTRALCAVALVLGSCSSFAATFSDANWISIGGGIAGTDGGVLAAATDGLGNLYIGGTFTMAGGVFAANIAKWDGSSWTALGSGMDGLVLALAVSGTKLYAGGFFTTAGGITVN